MEFPIADQGKTGRGRSFGFKKKFDFDILSIGCVLDSIRPGV